MNTTTTPNRIRVWDLPTRLFHWSLAASFFIAFFTAEAERWRDVHVIAGYTVGGLLVFRLLWGFVGNRHARFAELWPTPEKLLRYLKSLTSRHPEHYLGHNPAGAVAILLLLGLGLLTVTSGWLTYEEISGELFEEVHETLGEGMLALVVLHIAGVIVSSRLHGENLVRAMIDGWKRCPSDENSAG